MGPAGMGPMTGRGAGYCGGYEAPGHANPAYRMGMGWRRAWGGRGGGWGRPWGGAWGRGRGWRHMAYVTGMPGWVRAGYGPAWGPPPAAGFSAYGFTPTPEEETEYLRSQAEWLKEELDAITRRIEELERGA